MSFYNLKEKHFTRTEVTQAFIYQPEKGHRSYRPPRDKLKEMPT